MNQLSGVRNMDSYLYKKNRSGAVQLCIGLELLTNPFHHYRTSDPR